MRSSSLEMGKLNITDEAFYVEKRRKKRGGPERVSTSQYKQDSFRSARGVSDLRLNMEASMAQNGKTEEGVSRNGPRAEYSSLVKKVLRCRHGSLRKVSSRKKRERRKGQALTLIEAKCPLPANFIAGKMSRS